MIEHHTTLLLWQAQILFERNGDWYVKSAPACKAHFKIGLLARPHINMIHAESWVQPVANAINQPIWIDALVPKLHKHRPAVSVAVIARRRYDLMFVSIDDFQIQIVPRKSVLSPQLCELFLVRLRNHSLYLALKDLVDI